MDESISFQSPSGNTRLTGIECKALRVIPPEDGSGLGLAIMPDNNGRAKVEVVVPQSPAMAAKGLSGKRDEKIDYGDVLISVNGEDMLSKEYNDVVFALHDARKEGDIDLIFCRGSELDEWPIDADEPSFCLSPLQPFLNSDIQDPCHDIRVSPRVSLNFDSCSLDIESPLHKTSRKLDSEEHDVSESFTKGDLGNADTDTDTISMSEQPPEPRDSPGFTTEKDNNVLDYSAEEHVGMDIQNTISTNSVYDGITPDIRLMENAKGHGKETIGSSTTAALSKDVVNGGAVSSLLQEPSVAKPESIDPTPSHLSESSVISSCSKERVNEGEVLTSLGEPLTTKPVPTSIDAEPCQENSTTNNHDDDYWWSTTSMVATIGIGLISAVVVTKPRIAKSIGRIIFGCVAKTK